jgi:hypothetical protein
MSSPDPARPAPSAAAAYWRGWPEIRADVPTAIGMVAVLTLVGFPAGLVWWALAPRASYRITSDGAVLLGNGPTSELRIADDGVFALVLAGVGLICGVAAWQLRRRRGVATVVALGLGTSATAAVAWQLGQLLGAGPARADLTHVGARVTTGLALHSLAALAVAPFVALLAYLVGVVYARGDDLGRAGGGTEPAGEEPTDDSEFPVEEERSLVQTPPAGRPSV